jgi:LysM repeat protein
MKFLVSLLRYVPPLVLGLFLSGCFQPGLGQNDEEKEPYFLIGKSRLNTMDYPGAVEAFEKALTLNPKSAAAHFELGCLFAQKVPDPAAAIHHYNCFLKLRPNAPNAEWVGQIILACKQDLARTVSLGPVTEKQQRDLEKLAEDNKRLTDENRRLHEEVTRWQTYAAALPHPQPNPPPRVLQPNISKAPASAQVPVSAASTPPVLTPVLLVQHPRQAESARKPEAMAHGPLGAGAPFPPNGAPAGVARTHIIKRGETLAGIARQYGVRLEALCNANPRANPRHLRPGQTLNLPPP